MYYSDAGIATSVSVCMSICLHAYLNTCVREPGLAKAVFWKMSFFKGFRFLGFVKTQSLEKSFFLQKTKFK